MTYRPVVHYRYRVADAEYTGERESFGEFASGDRGDAEAVLQRYPKGRRVPVHYQPAAPGRSVLEAGDPPAHTARGPVRDRTASPRLIE